MKTITNSRIGYNGRLGNQLFQFASLYGISRKCEKIVAIPFDNTNSVNEILCDGSNISAKFSAPDIFKKINKFLHKIESFNGKYKHISEPGFTFSQSVIDESREDCNIDLNGYFQSPLYFYEYRKEILDLLAFKDSPKEKRDKPTVSIHVRRKDYLALSLNHPVCSMSYYAAAIDQFYGCDFIVFSDDIEWCKSVFPKEFIFSQNYTEEDDLRLMSECDHNIIANSTFSWWGAYLNQNKDRRIIAPKNWFGSNYSHYDTSEITSIATQLL